MFVYSLHVRDSRRGITYTAVSITPFRGHSSNQSTRREYLDATSGTMALLMVLSTGLFSDLTAPTTALVVEKKVGVSAG